MRAGEEFTFSNLSARGPGPFVRVAGRVMPGVSRVQATVAPFAGQWRQRNLVAVESGEPLWVALGDSLTQGIGASAPDRGWVGLVSDRLAAAGHRHAVVNLGVSGATTAEVIAHQVPALRALPAELVTLMIGSNDLMRPANRRALPERMAHLLGALPEGAVVTTMPNPSPAARRANAEIARVAADRGLVVAELRDPRLGSWRGRLAADHFHPNDAGYAAIAEVLGEILLDVVAAP